MRCKNIPTPGRVYLEENFCGHIRHEAKRSERSGHLCRILLVYRTNAQGLAVPLGAELSDKILWALSRNSRDTDYVGWYRQGRIIGVLMTTLLRDSVVKDGTNLETRLVDRLCGALMSTGDQFLQIRVLELGELTTFSASTHPASIPVSKV